MSLRERAQLMFGGEGVINDDFVDKMREAAKGLPDDVLISDLAITRYYEPGHRRLSRPFPPNLYDWISKIVKLDGDQKRQIDATFRAFRRSKSIKTVGDLRATSLESLYDSYGIGPLRAVFLKSIFNRDEDS